MFKKRSLTLLAFNALVHFRAKCLTFRLDDKQEYDHDINMINMIMITTYLKKFYIRTLHHNISARRAEIIEKKKTKVQFEWKLSIERA